MGTGGPIAKVTQNWHKTSLNTEGFEPSKKAPSFRSGLSNLIGRLPTLPHTRACSTIGAEGLNFRVRDGNGWDPLAKVTQNWMKTSLNIDGF